MKREVLNLTTPKKMSLSLPYPLIIAVLQTLIATLPGMLLIEDRVDISFALILLFLYLLLSEFFQVFIRTAYANRQSVALNVYVGKVVLSIICIWIISNQLAPQYGVILLMYEVFQYFTFSEKYDYQSTFLYTLLNAFFKGIVFNLVVSIHYPYSFKLIYATPYLFSFLLVVIGTLLTQSLYSQQGRHTGYNRLSAIFFLIVLVYLGFQVYTKQLAWFLLLPIIMIILGTTWFILRHNNLKKRELTLNVALLLLLFTYYL